MTVDNTSYDEHCQCCVYMYLLSTLKNETSTEILRVLVESIIFVCVYEYIFVGCTYFCNYCNNNIMTANETLYKFEFCL